MGGRTRGRGSLSSSVASAGLPAGPGAVPPGRCLRAADSGRKQALLRPQPTIQDHVEATGGRVVSGRCEDGWSTDLRTRSPPVRHDLYGRRVRAGWGESQGVSPAGHLRAEGTADGDADPADRPRAAQRPDPGAHLRRARHRPRRDGTGRRRLAAGGRRVGPRELPERWGRGAPRRAGAAGRAPDRAGRASPGGRRGPLAPGARRRGGDGRPRPGPAPRGGRTGRGRGPPAARRADPDRPLRRRGRPPRRPGRLAAALRGHGRRRRPGLGRRPRLDERHLAGRGRGARAPGPPRPRRAAAARRVRPPPRPGLPSAASDDRP